MEAPAKSGLSAERIKPKIGTHILNSKEDLLSGHLGPEIMDLLEKRGVLVFPEIGFTDAEHIAFTKTLGPFARELRGEELYKVSLDEGENATAEYLKAAFFWHFDGFMSPMPIRASLLAAKRVSPPGTGATEICSTYAAYDALPDADKEALEGLRAVHALAATQLDVTPEPSYNKWLEWRGIGRKELPLVWTHRSGRKSLVIGNSAHAVLGMDPLDSEELLVRLRDFATRPEFTYSHDWKVGDLLLYDNTGTLHRATAYPLDCGRMLHRTKLEGDEPVV